jgi:hypothetical protein
MSFQATAGWSDDGITTVTVRVARDPCSTVDGAQKKYYDRNLNVQYTTGPDPGFNEPSIGAPAYFRVGDFEFCGLIQSWRQMNDVAGMPTYEIRLTAPIDILNGMQLIINDYAGAVTYYDLNLNTQLGVYNLFNVYGFMEQYGYYCPQTEIYGAVFGTPANAYGGALTNDNGMSWNRIKQGISLLTSAFPAQINNFSPYGRIMFCGASDERISRTMPDGTSYSVNRDGYGVIKYDLKDNLIPLYYANHEGYMAQYFIDLSEVPAAPDYWRIGGTSVSMMEAISQVCKDAGCDFYVELIPVKWAGYILKFIKVRTVSRRAQPVLGAISNFIGNVGGCISNSVGQELRNEPTTSFMVGGNVQSIFQAISGSPGVVIGPYYGIDSNKNLNPYWKNSYGDYEVELDITALNAQLHVPLNVNTVTVDESEMRNAIDSYDSWLSWADLVNTDLGVAIRDTYGNSQHIITSDAIAQIMVNLGAGKRIPSHWLSWSDSYAKYGDRQTDLDRIYQFISTFAREHYGKSFLVKLPYTCTYVDPESQTVNISESPSTDGGWTEYPTVIGLPNGTVYTDFFAANDKGLLGPIAGFTGIATCDNVEISPNDYSIYGTNIYVKADINESILYENFATYTGPHVLVTLPNPVFVKEDTDGSTADVSFIPEICTRNNYAIPKAELESMTKALLANQILFGVYRKAKTPTAIAVPLKSNISTYGPWVRRGPAGSVRVERDDGLVPWEYGSIAGMNTAGLARVNDAITSMQISELGEVVVPGYPTIPLGAEIGAVDGGFYGGGQNLIENRNVSSESFNEGSSSITYYKTTQGQWTGLYGPNITNITVDVGPQGIQTNYQMRTFTPVAGRFSKAHLERFRQLTGQRSKLLKQARGRQFVLGRIATARKFSQGILPQEHRGKSKAKGNETSVDVFAGQIHTWDKVKDDDALRISSVSALPANELSSERDDFDLKSFMSLDGLLRPVSKSGDGGLPRYVSYTSDPCNKIPHQSESITPPITGYTPISISTMYLDPTAGTNSPKHGTSIGHDIKILARGDGGSGLTSLNCHIDEKGVGYIEPTDYRFLALRGPLVVHGWGYDLQGKPIPNAADDEESCAIGDFNDEDLQDSFLTDWMRKSHTWPVAPVDLRYDRKRGVWTVPNGFRMIRATANVTISGGATGLCTPINIGDVYDANGLLVEHPKIEVVVPSGFSALRTNDPFIAYFDTNDCKYYAITPGCGRTSPGDPANTKCRVVKTIECSDNALTVVYSYLEFSPCGLFVGCTGLTFSQ